MQYCCAVQFDESLFMMVLFTRFLSFFSCGLFLVVMGCSKEVDTHYDHTLSIEDERKIGQHIDNALIKHFENSTSKYVLSSDDHPDVYAYLQQCVQALHQSDHFDDLLEEHPLSNHTPIIRVLQDPGNTGAFIAPGGHIYLYTDFLHTVQTEAQFMAVLSHLITCSAYKFDLKKLEVRFSRAFLFDVALGYNLSASSTTNSPRDRTDLHDVLIELEDVPYEPVEVTRADYEIEPILCELDYDLRSYSDLHHLTAPLKWLTLFPRSLTTNDYSTHLNHLHSNDPSCNGQTVAGDYSDFKLLLP